MQGWGSIKQDLINATGLSKDALHIYVGVLLLVTFALFLRRRINDPVPWLCVVAAVLVNELADYLHYLGSDHRYVRFALSDVLSDVFNSLAIPAMICALKLDGRFGAGVAMPAVAGLLRRSGEAADSQSRGHSRSRYGRRLG